MESQSGSIQISVEQTSSHLAKQPTFPSPSGILPSDSQLIQLISQFPTTPPFILIQKPIVLKDKPLHERSCFELHQKILNYSRKEKSLEELSKKFIHLFEGQKKEYLELDKVTKDLNVQRRRIYDVINILQSLRIVNRKGKNCYRWIGLEKGIQAINECQKYPQSFEVGNQKRQRSLETLSNNFLKMIVKKNIISLEEAAKQIINDVDDEILKTKMRRLYDIVNVYKALGLVKKISLSTKKPGFKWLGAQGIAAFLKENKLQANQNSQTKEEQTKVLENEIFENIPQNSNGFFLNLVRKNSGCTDALSLSQTLAQSLFIQSSKGLLEGLNLHKCLDKEDKRKLKPRKSLNSSEEEDIE